MPYKLLSHNVMTEPLAILILFLFINCFKECECLLELTELLLCVGPLSKAVQMAEDLSKRAAALENPGE